jgi:cardiolipin synthase
MRHRSSLIWKWLIHLPRIVLAVLLAQVSLMAGLFAYAKIRKRAVESVFPQLEIPPIPVGQHEVQVFDDGASVFRQMLDDIEQAQHVIFLESYIFERDEVGIAFKRALIRKARQGVKVYVIFDGIGSLHVPTRFKSFGRRRNIRVFEFGRLRSLRSYFDIKMWVRTHRKILVIDGEKAYLGGMNIGRPYARTWRDTHLKIVGPMAGNVAHEFIDLWNEHFDRHPILLSYERTTDAQIWICGNDPFRGRLPIKQTYLDAINGSKRNIYITNAYFLPDRDIINALVTASRRGVDVQVMVPEISDNIVVDWITRGLCLELLRGGVRILLYCGTMLHSKTMTVDGEWSTVGSANLDGRSLTSNYEINATVVDQAFARQMEAMYLNDYSQSREIFAAAWASRNVLQQFGEWSLQPLRGLF